ncbi:hypothetical protein SDC9_113208 [bioreactor metagenome]|uniref:DUF2953 domain-containing protein n=1 Tax=bioreactor metagenome TaxID=1076179 RepID=A0A645BNZ8_9ZZZZ
MRGWLIFGGVLLALWLISLLRLGAAVAYGKEGLLVKILAGPFRFAVYPPKEKKAKKKGKAKPQKEKKKEEKESTLDTFRRYLPLISEAAGRLKRKVRIDNIELDLIWGDPNPASAAAGYGYVNVVLGMLWPLIENNFHVKNRNIHTAVEFDAKEPSLSVKAGISLTVGQGAVLAAILGIKFLSIHRQNKMRKQMRKEAV